MGRNGPIVAVVVRFIHVKTNSLKEESLHYAQNYSCLYTCMYSLSSAAASERHMRRIVSYVWPGR